ncbi:MAG: DNA helicase UvrD, partial [Betaproteobacteria bacterium]|nr:DNA helicase UvrD [Betaproteobacteria bacterium]
MLVRDLFSLTTALLNLGDKLAWLSVLRAPYCGLILDDLLILSDCAEGIIYQQLSDANALAKLSADGRFRAEHLHHCLQGVFANQGRFDFVELLSYALQQLGISQSLTAIEVMIKDQFLQIIYECESQQLLNISAIEAALADLYAPSENARLKLMTIHQAKGLEFDTVIIPSLGRTPATDKSPIMQLKVFADNSLLLAPIKSSFAADESGTYRYLKFINSQQNKFETMRLLYVAMTRARRNLHLLGEANKSGKAAANSLLALLFPFYQKDFEQLPEPNIQTNLEPEVINPPKLQRFKHLKTPPKITTKIRGEALEYQPNFERLFKSLLGTLLHQYYEFGLFSPSITNISARLIELGTPNSEILCKIGLIKMKREIHEKTLYFASGGRAGVVELPKPFAGGGV